MIKEIKNKNISVLIDQETGCVISLTYANDADQMNWLISPDVLLHYGYHKDSNKMLGKSYLHYNDTVFNTEDLTPRLVLENEAECMFEYDNHNLLIQQKFQVSEEDFRWYIKVKNIGKQTIYLDEMYHWLPLHYVMHETIDENLRQSCSVVPSVSGDKSYVICRKRSGEGPDLFVINKGGKMRSIGSLCRYKNLFFEKSAPSLSGVVLFHTVHTFQDKDRKQLEDWQYDSLNQMITLQPDEIFEDEYIFTAAAFRSAENFLQKHEVPVFDFLPVYYLSSEVTIKVKSLQKPKQYTIYAAVNGVVETEYTGGLEKAGHDLYVISLDGFQYVGERKLLVTFEDNTQAFIIFTVYQSMEIMVEAFCDGIYKNRFIEDINHTDYCGYQSISRQGEACAKGSLLLLKNLLSRRCTKEIRQVEMNAVYYLRQRWLDEHFIAKKQYPGGFARIIDMDYLILEFYLLSKVEQQYLKINKPDVYLLWAYHTAVYRFTVTPDKLPREAVEVELTSMISWIHMEMIEQLEVRGFFKESKHLKFLWETHIQIQLRKTIDKSFIETEHYFDNAGISVYIETLFNNGNNKEAIEAADLLLANVAPSTDYRNYAPDRWWEAVAPMYHNLWAVFSAKALLTAYEKTRDSKYLLPAYRAMMPMFYNYDWNAVSAKKQFAKGEGVSAYCITSPNLNILLASRNRFGQSIFQDEFFQQMDISGDDWDLGADLIVYLYTFGQRTYVIGENENLCAVNGRLKACGDVITVWSDAAYPTYYDIAPCHMLIKRSKGNFFIESVTIQGNECLFVTIRGYVETADSIFVSVNGKEQTRKVVIKHGV